MTYRFRVLSDAAITPYPTYIRVTHRPDKTRQRHIRHRLSDAARAPYPTYIGVTRRPDKTRQRRIRHRLSDA
ncbi:hypothetical protein LZA97_01730, partial [Escherichia marmotae]|uniref:hypothetical protein n=1 Tax=Escherichia marmotae TaxID=1499973 RepID=UPI002FE122A1